MLIKVLMNEMDLSRGTFSNAVPNFPMINFMRRLRISFLCNAVLSPLNWLFRETCVEPILW